MTLIIIMWRYKTIKTKKLKCRFNKCLKLNRTFLVIMKMIIISRHLETIKMVLQGTEDVGTSLETIGNSFLLSHGWLQVGTWLLHSVGARIGTIKWSTKTMPDLIMWVFKCKDGFCCQILVVLSCKSNFLVFKKMNGQRNSLRVFKPIKSFNLVSI